MSLRDNPIEDNECETDSDDLLPVFPVFLEAVTKMEHESWIQLQFRSNRKLLSEECIVARAAYG